MKIVRQIDRRSTGRPGARERISGRQCSADGSSPKLDWTQPHRSGGRQVARCGVPSAHPTTRHPSSRHGVPTAGHMLRSPRDDPRSSCSTTRSSHRSARLCDNTVDDLTAAPRASGVLRPVPCHPFCIALATTARISGYSVPMARRMSSLAARRAGSQAATMPTRPAMQHDDQELAGRGGEPAEALAPQRFDDGPAEEQADARDRARCRATR